MSDSQASFWYQYLVGLAFFLPGLYLGYRVRAWSFRKGERSPLILLLTLMGGYLIVQGFLEFIAPTL